jgi:iron complex outermembrane recepter protein
VRQDNPGYTDNQQASFSAKATYDLGFANLISVTSYQDWKYNFAADVDGSDLNVNGSGTPVTNPVGPSDGVNQSGPYHSHEFTQELRLASKGSGALSYVAGLFYANAATTRSFVRGPVLILADWNGYQGTRSLAAFAGLDYKLPTHTTISLSGRLNNERIQDQFTDLLPSHNASTAVADADCGIGAPDCAGRHTDTVGTWKVAISQELAPRVSAYGSVATGYKGYAYDISSGYTPSRTDNPVKAEHSTAYEIGLKSRFWHNRAQLNVAGFYTDYNNFQAQSSQYIGNVLYQKLNNVGKLRTKGVEVESQVKPVEWMHLDGSFAYTEAKILSFPNAACYAGQAADQASAGLASGPTGTNFCGASTNPAGLGNVQDRSGSQLPNSPKFKFNLAGTVNHDLGHDTQGSLTITYQHQSSINFDLLGDPLDTQKAYGLMNLTLGAEHGAYKLSLFVNNLFDTHYAVSMGDGFGSYGVHVISAVLPRDSQRYGGVKLGVKF